MRLSWNEIRVRAAAFAQEWRDAAYEKGETQSFYNDFFGVFGIRRRFGAKILDTPADAFERPSRTSPPFWKWRPRSGGRTALVSNAEGLAERAPSNCPYPAEFGFEARRPRLRGPPVPATA